MKKIVILLMLMYSMIALYGENVATLVGTEKAAILINGSSISEIQSNTSVPHLIPNVLGIKTLIQSVLHSFKPNIMVEGLYLYKKPVGANPGEWTDEERAAVFNRSVAISSLAGIQYYSNSSKSIKTFYEDSIIIDNPESKNPLQDPTFQIPPEDLLLYARQKDLTFGDNIYQYEYHAENDYFVFTQENLTAMNAGIIRVLGKNKLRSVVAVIDADAYLLIYAISMADTIMIPGMSQRIGQSFVSRAEAVLHWFTGQADKAFL
ncbi:MAG: hypothetical protein LBV20_05460 [Treponema sp.]|jgi:hypothetical protein|nr:hypothetical protein [Treponema sp.]